MTIYKIVIENLKKKAISNPNKTMLELLQSNSLKAEDLIALNKAFPTNSYNTQKLPEGCYSSQEAIMQFIRFVGPYLSDRALYDITHHLAQIETSISDVSQAYRNSSLAKYFLIYEIERHTTHTPDGQLPGPFISHIKAYILPFCEKRPTSTSLKDDVNNFVLFNFYKNEIINAEVKKKCMGIDVYSVLHDFSIERFNCEKLSKIPLKDPKELNGKLEELEKSYAKQTEENIVQKSLSAEQNHTISSPKNLANATMFFAKTPTVKEALNNFISCKEQEIAKITKDKDTAEKALPQLKKVMLNKGSLKQSQTVNQMKEKVNLEHMINEINRVIENDKSQLFRHQAALKNATNKAQEEGVLLKKGR